MTNQGNEQNLQKVQELRRQHELKEQADKVNLGNGFTSGVHIDYTSVFGTEVKGWVEFKRPSMLEYMQMGGLKSEILRQAGVRDINLVDNQIKFMAHVISTLKTVIVKSPEWLLNIDNVKEPDILYHVYGKYEEWEDSFRKPSESKSEGDSEATE